MPPRKPNSPASKHEAPSPLSFLLITDHLRRCRMLNNENRKLTNFFTMSHIVTEPPEGVTYPLSHFERRAAHLIGRQFTVQLEGRPPVSVTFTMAYFPDLEEPRF